MKKLLSTLVLLLMAFMAHAATEINGIYYNLDSSTKTAEVTENPNKYSGSVSIPSTVSYGGYSYRVTSIGDEAFYDCYNLTSFDIPNSVTSIGNYAFAYCSNLTSVTIPNSVTSIGDGAFSQCSSLPVENNIRYADTYLVAVVDRNQSTYQIKERTRFIGTSAFQNCSNLTSIDIPNSVTSIGSNAFIYCSKLSSVTIPNNVTSIGGSAFSRCSSLTSIDIPNSVTSMGISPFSYCYNITSIKVEDSNPNYDSRNNCNAIIETVSNTLVNGCVNTTIPTSVTSIGDEAFSGCSSLESITIPNNVKTIGDYAFSWCTMLNSITIPTSVTSIGNNAFSGCSSLESITIPNSVTSIGNNAFSGCSSLPIKNNIRYADTYLVGAVDKNQSTYQIKEHTRFIGSDAFSDCTSLTSITIPTSVTSIGSSAFQGCSGLTSITIPNNVKTIGDDAFLWCTMLNSITIPNSVTSIGGYAFWNCASLTSVTVENPSPVTIEQNTFSNRANATLYVPKGSKSAYLAADFWKEFKEIIENNTSHDAGLGDVNGDGEISIADVTLLVDYLLEQAGDNFILANADVNKDGRISVSDAVSIIKLILEGEPEPQAYLTCPDSNHPHMIDLGLPSGTKWACCNVGADKPEAYGGYYAWGETEEKSVYHWSTYIHCDGSPSTCHDLGSDISGTQYDVAHVKWGGSWVMPSYDQQKELLENCNHEWTTVNGVNGRKFTSMTNGGTIFLPAAGSRDYSDLYGAGSGGLYWSSTQNPSSSNYAYFLFFNSGSAYWSRYYRTSGRTVRPVSR